MEEQPEKKEPVFISVASLSKEEREEWKKNLPRDAREVIEQHEREGALNRCPKTDWCAKFNEEKRQKEGEEQAKKRQEMEALQKRNAILEAAARHQEAKQKEQEERLKKAEERMEKMASLLAQLISK